jgi:hypothetical protein
MNITLQLFIEFLQSQDGIGDKSRLMKLALTKFEFVKDRTVYYSSTGTFAVRFSYSASGSFSNTVLSLSKLQKFDTIPFIVCLVTPNQNYLFLANTTFLIKISHSSQELSLNNIKGSFNGSDISKTFNGIQNRPENFDKLFAIHAELGFEGNLVRLVEATTGISPSGKKFEIRKDRIPTILASVDRAQSFINSANYEVLKKDLDTRVSMYENEIFVASLIENVNIRGRIIEYLIAGNDDDLKKRLVKEINEEFQKISHFKTDNALGDYRRVFGNVITETDVKTKIMILNSNPKAYNIDKFLEFLSEDGTVFLFYFIGISTNKILNKVLVSVYQRDLLSSTVILKHWSGRNSRGVTQFEGSTIHKLINSPNGLIDRELAKKYLDDLIKL